MARNRKLLESLLFNRVNLSERKIGLKLNIHKVPYLTNTEKQGEIYIGGQNIEIVESFVYVGKNFEQSKKKLTYTEE